MTAPNGTTRMHAEELYYSFFGLTILICIFGCVGNGHVIWMLGFRIKKTTFSTYFLNLAVADLGTVAFLAVSRILKVKCSVCRFWAGFLYIFFFAIYMASLCFLTTIGMERCASVLLPRWYQRHRPKCLTTMLSFLIWALSGTFFITELPFYLVYYLKLYDVLKIAFVVNFWILPPLVAIWTSVLLIGLCCRYRKHPPQSLSIVITLMLLFFLIFGGPCIIMLSLRSLKGYHLIKFSHLFVSANSSIKPIFYYLAGKQWKCCSKEPLVIRLQKVFQDEVDATDGSELMVVDQPAEGMCSVQTA